MTPPDSFYLGQERQLELFASDRVKAFLALLENARREMNEALINTGADSAALNATARQLDAIARQLAVELTRQGVPVQALTEMAAGHQTEAIRRLIENPSIFVDFNRLSVQNLMTFAQNELAKVTSITSQVELQKIKTAMFTRIGVQGQNPQEVAKLLTGKGGQFTKPYGVIENILRTEASTIYNTQSVASIEYVNTQYGQTLEKRILEKIDPKRNHPISMVLNGQQQPVGKPFKAKVSEVEAAARRIKKSSTGIFWPKKNGYYVGQKLPAHYRERGIVIAAVRGS